MKIRFTVAVLVGLSMVSNAVAWQASNAGLTVAVQPSNATAAQWKAVWVKDRFDGSDGSFIDGSFSKGRAPKFTVTLPTAPGTWFARVKAFDSHGSVTGVWTTGGWKVGAPTAALTSATARLSGPVANRTAGAPTSTPAGIVAKNGAAVIGDHASGIVAAGAGNIVAAGAGNAIGQHGAGVVGTGGGSFAGVRRLQSVDSAPAVASGPSTAQIKLQSDLATYDNLIGQFAQHQDCLTQFQAAHPNAAATKKFVDANRHIATDRPTTAAAIAANDQACALGSAGIENLIPQMSQALHDCQTQRNTALTKANETPGDVANAVMSVLATVFRDELGRDKTGQLSALLGNAVSSVVKDAVNDCKTNFHGDASAWGRQLTGNKAWYKQHYNLTRFK